MGDKVDPADQLWMDQLKELLGKLAKSGETDLIKRLAEIGLAAKKLVLPKEATTEDREDFARSLKVLEDGLTSHPDETTVDLSEGRLLGLERQIAAIQARPWLARLAEVGIAADELALPEEATTDDREGFAMALKVLRDGLTSHPDETTVDLSEGRLARLRQNIEAVKERIAKEKRNAARLVEIGKAATETALVPGASPDEVLRWTHAKGAVAEKVTQGPTDEVVLAAEGLLEAVLLAVKEIGEAVALRKQRLAEIGKAGTKPALPKDAEESDVSAFTTLQEELAQACEATPTKANLQTAELALTALEEKASAVEAKRRIVRKQRLGVLKGEAASAPLAKGPSTKEQTDYDKTLKLIADNVDQDATEENLASCELWLVALKKLATAPQARRDAEKGLEAARAKYDKARKPVAAVLDDALVNLPRFVGKELRGRLLKLDEAVADAKAPKDIDDQALLLAPLRGEIEGAVGFFRLREMVRFSKAACLALAGVDEVSRLEKLITEADTLGTEKKWTLATQKLDAFLKDPKCGKVTAYYEAIATFKKDLATELKYFEGRKPNQFPAHYNPLTKFDDAKAPATPVTGTSYDNAVIAVNALRVPFGQLHDYMTRKGRLGAIASKTTNAGSVNGTLTAAKNEVDKNPANIAGALALINALPFKNLTQGAYAATVAEAELSSIVKAMEAIDSSSKAYADVNGRYAAAKVDYSNKSWSQAISGFQTAKPIAEAALEFLVARAELKALIARASSVERPDVLAPANLKETAKKYVEAKDLLPDAEATLAEFVQYAEARDAVTGLKKQAADTSELDALNDRLLAAKQAADAGLYIVGRDVLQGLLDDPTLGERAEKASRFARRKKALSKRRVNLAPRVAVPQVKTHLLADETTAQTEFDNKKLDDALTALDTLESDLGAAEGWADERLGIVGLIDGLAKTKVMGLHNYDAPTTTATTLGKNLNDGDTKAKTPDFPGSLVEYKKARTGADAVAVQLSKDMDNQHGGHSAEKHGPGVSDQKRRDRVKTGVPDPRTRFSSRFLSGSAWMQAYSAAVAKILSRDGVDVSTATTKGKSKYVVNVEHGQPIGMAAVGFEEKLEVGTKRGEKGEPVDSVTFARTIDVEGLTRSIHVFSWDGTNNRYYLLTQYPYTADFDVDLGEYTAPMKEAS